MALKLKTPPATEPVTVQEVKDYLRITDTADDVLLNLLTSAIRQKCEAVTRRALVTQTWTLFLDGFPKRERNSAPKEGYFQLPVDHFDQVQSVIEIPRPPLQSITFIKTYDTANAVLTFDITKVLVDAHSEPGRIALNQGQAWPTNLRNLNSVEIEFVAGYGTASAVPEAIKSGMLLWIKLLKASRSKLFEPEEKGQSQGLLELTQSRVPPQVKAAWGPYEVSKL